MPTRNLFIIRIALMTGVFLFAGLVFFGPRLGFMPVREMSPRLEPLRYLLWAFVSISVAGALLLRSKFESAAPDKRAAFLVIGWTLGEAPALLGSALHLGGGSPANIGLGLMAFVFTLVMLPIPQARR